jgi:hypothetical protein
LTLVAGKFRFMAHAGAASSLRSDLEKGVPLHPQFHPLVEGYANLLTIYSYHKQVYGLYSWHRDANEGCSCSLLVFCCLTGALSGWSCTISEKLSAHSLRLVRTRTCKVRTERKPIRVLNRRARASILETAKDAAYSSLRRKKSHSLPGDMLLRPEHEWSTLASGAISKQRALPFGWTLARAASKHDVETLRGSAPRTPKSKAGERL